MFFLSPLVGYAGTIVVPQSGQGTTLLVECPPGRLVSGYKQQFLHRGARALWPVQIVIADHQALEEVNQKIGLLSFFLGIVHTAGLQEVNCLLKRGHRIAITAPPHPNLAFLVKVLCLGINHGELVALFLGDLGFFDRRVVDNLHLEQSIRLGFNQRRRSLFPEEQLKGYNKVGFLVGPHGANSSLQSLEHHVATGLKFEQFRGLKGGALAFPIGPVPYRNPSF